MPRVLVVDEDGAARRALVVALALDGFEVFVARSSAEALETLLTQVDLDVALIDLMMAGLNGLELARSIRRVRPEVRVVLTSAYHLSARQVERADCGAVGFVPKPYKVAEVCDFLRSKAHADSERLSG